MYDCFLNIKNKIPSRKLVLFINDACRVDLVLGIEFFSDTRTFRIVPAQLTKL